MNQIDKLLNNLFPNGQPQQPEILDSGELSERKIKLYSKWKKGKRPETISKELTIAFSQNRKNANIRVFFHHSPGANGFYIDFLKVVQPKEGIFIQEWMAEILKANTPYRLAHSAQRTRLINRKTEVTRLLYLKPPLPTSPPPYAQWFGNIHLEYMEQDQKPCWVKLMAFHYNDHLFLPALRFEDLLLLMFPQNT
jgi:hypothetical protein